MERAGGVKPAIDLHEFMRNATIVVQYFKM